MKESDLTVPAGNGLLNIRVGAIIQRDGNVLMVSNPGVGYFYSVGGRLRFGETTEEAVEREVFEETGVRMKAARLGFIHENFFTGDSGFAIGLPVHEIAFFYYMDVPADFEPSGVSYTDLGDRETLEWIDPRTETRAFYPEFFKEELETTCRTVKRIVSREWQE